MFLRLNPHKLFFITVLFSAFIGYVFRSGIIAFSPLILMSFLVVIVEFTSFKKIPKKHLLITILWLPYVIWAGFIYISNPLEGRYLSTHFLTILILPIIVLSYTRLFYSNNACLNYEFIYKSLFFFLLLQIIICLGQISTYITGTGFPVNELYAESRMVTGTFFNSNDLAAVVLAITFVVVGLERFFFMQDKFIFWLLVFILLLITGSRSAIVLASLLFVLSKFTELKKVLIYSSLLIILSVFSFLILNSVENEVVSRFIIRINSLINVFQNGISADNSMTMRVNSYLHFINMLPELSFGSQKLNNYILYAEGVEFRVTELLFQNPHSLIVEVGYWLGWPGLISFIVPLLVLLSYSRRKTTLIFTLLIVSMIPSSILGNMIFFLILILSFFDYKQLDKRTQVSS